MRKESDTRVPLVFELCLEDIEENAAPSHVKPSLRAGSQADQADSMCCSVDLRLEQTRRSATGTLLI